MPNKRGVQGRNWTPLEDARLRQLAKQGLTHAAIAEQIPGRTTASVVTRRRTLGLQPGTIQYTMETVKHSTRSEAEIEAQINRVYAKRRAAYSQLNGLLFDDYRRTRLVHDIEDADLTLARLWAELRVARLGMEVVA